MRLQPYPVPSSPGTLPAVLLESLVLATLSGRGRTLLTLVAALMALALPVALAPAADAATVKPLDIVKIQYDPSGKDYSTNSGYVREYIVLKNTGTKKLTLTGYVIRDNGPQKFTFPKGFAPGAGTSVTIKSGKGKNSSSTLYWNKSSYIWNNTGDTARTYNSKGKLLESCKYRGGTHKATKTYVRTTSTTAYC